MRHSIRLPHYDYSQPGIYFVTICTYRRTCILGDIVEDTLRITAFGDIVGSTWRWLADQYPHIQLDEYIIMPNHLHGLIMIHDGDGTQQRESTRGKPLGRLVGAFKTVSTKRINQLRGTPHAPIWQRGFYEHVVRNTDSLERIRSYITTNPVRWAIDPENPAGNPQINHFRHNQPTVVVPQ